MDRGTNQGPGPRGPRGASRRDAPRSKAVRRGVLAGFAALCTTAAAAAQGPWIVPPGRATTVGATATNVPFGRGTPTRVQLLYDASAFVGGARVLTAVAFRAEEAAALVGKRVDVELAASTFGAAVSMATDTFAANRGTDVVTALTRRIVDLPSAPPAAPGDFVARLPFDQGFAFDPTRGALNLEIAVHAQPPGVYVLDATWLVPSAARPVGPAGCGPAGGPVLTVGTLTNHVAWGERLVLRVADARPAAPTGIVLAPPAVPTWNGVALPADLGRYGAPGCFVTAYPAVTASVVADALGVAVYDLALPADPRLLDAVFWFQGVAVDASANALGIVTSQAAELVVDNHQPVARVYSAGLVSPIGLLEIGVAPILRLEGR